MAVATEQLVERIWSRDPTVWTGADEAQWLGWLDEPIRMRGVRAGAVARAHDAETAPLSADGRAARSGGAEVTHAA